MNRHQSPFAKRQNRTATHSRLAQVMLADAIRHHQAGRLTEAVRIYQLALALKPDSLEADSNLGAALHALGKFDEAVACLQQALALKPHSAEAWFNLAATRKAQGNLDDAVTCYQRALALDPDCPGAHHNLAKILHDQGKLDAAVAHYQRALALDPNYAEAHGNLGNTLHAQGRLPRAAAHHERALAIKPDLPESHYNLGNVVFALPARFIFLPAGGEVAGERVQPARQTAAGDWGLGQTRNPLDQPAIIDRRVDQFSDIDLFAAQIAAMDVVITIDNSTAHLAGALGVPTFLLLPFAPEWRWLQALPDDTNDSPWYPAMRLCRQPKLSDWQSVIQTVEKAL